MREGRLGYNSYNKRYKPISYYAFEMLYWTGIREEELLALTPEWVVQLLRLQRGC